MAGATNLSTEGLEYLWNPGNEGSTLAGMNFPESECIDSAPGNNSFSFSGYDPFGKFDFYFNNAISGYKSYSSQIVTFDGAPGWIYQLGNSAIDLAGPGIAYLRGAPNFNSLYSIVYGGGTDPGGYGKSTLMYGNSGDLGVTSINKIGVLDLICEGPVEGFVTGTYFYSYAGKNTGDIGYTSYTFVPFTNSGFYGGSEDGNQYLESPPESRSIFWNDIPIVQKNGLYNFKSVNYKYTVGDPNLHTQMNPKINLFEDRYSYFGNQIDKFEYPLVTTRSKTINERLFGAIITTGIYDVGFPKSYSVYNTDVSSIKLNLKINALSQTIVAVGAGNQGDVWKENLKINLLLFRLFKDGSTALVDASQYWPYKSQYYFNQSILIRGKVSTPMMTSYEMAVRPFAENFPAFQLMQNQVGWSVTVTKLTQEGLPPGISNSCSVDSITEVYSDRFVYPNVAMVYNEFDSRYFNTIPTRSYRMRLLKVKIPNNYDPITRNYNGYWDGTFKLAWTDNPAWCYYDLITNDRYGLGKYIDSSLVDKWNLYEISQYCDQLVPDGNGGLEPRFTCNVMIAAKDEAYKVLNDMASIFRGITYYSAGLVFANQDRPKDIIYAFNNSNVVNGKFTYSDSSRRVRKTVATIRYNDQDDNYKPAIEYVEYRDGILKYGIREISVTAFGCTSRNQARRLGKWFLLTENLETETVVFDAGLEAGYLIPGDLVQIYDQNRRNVNFAGRTNELSTGSVTLDLPYTAEVLNNLTGFKSNFDINFLTPTYNLNYGTDLGNNYITGYGITSSGITGLNSDFFRRSAIQKVTIPLPTQNYITSGSGIYSNNIKINFPINARTPEVVGAGMGAVGNIFTKSAITAAWDSQVYSNVSYNSNMYAEAKANQANAAIMFGLNTDPTLNASFASLDYAWYFLGGGTLQIYENGGFVGDFGPYTTLTKLRIEYDGEWVSYLRDGVVIRATPVKNKNEYYYFDSSFNTPNGAIAANYGTFALNKFQYSLLQNTIWNIDVNISGYVGTNIRSPINNPLSLTYPGALYDGYLNEPQTYRILNIKEDPENKTYNVSAMQYVPQKYDEIDLDAKLTNVPNKPLIPGAPNVTLQGLYRDALGNLTGSNKLLYTTVQSAIGINSIAYSTAPSTNGSYVSQYLIYMRTGTPFTSLTDDQTDLIDVQPANVNAGFYPTDPVNGRDLGLYPPFFTPQYAGTFYFKIHAKNSLDELSAPTLATFVLSSQAPLDRVIASGVNVL
jgi:hypothetical protein